MSLGILTSTNFFLYSGYSVSDINSNYLDFLINQINGLIDEELEPIFSLNSLISKYYRDNASNVVIVGTWQPANRVVDITVTNGGTNYSDDTVVTITGGTPSITATVRPVITNGVITNIIIDNPGDDYDSTPTVTITDGTGSGATATATLSTLTVTLGSDGSTSSLSLTEGDDYRLLFLGGERRRPGEKTSVGAIQLYARLLSNRSYIQIDGTYGFSEVVPGSIMLEAQMYDLLKKAVQASETETETGGKGTIKSSKIDKVSVSFGGSGSDGRSETMTTKDALEISQGVIRNIRKKYEYSQNNFAAVIG